MNSGNAFRKVRKSVLLCGMLLCVLMWSACSGKTGQDRGGGTTGEAEAREDVSGELQKNDRTESNIQPDLNTQVNNEKTESGETDSMKRMKIGNTEVDVDWEDNESAEALKALCKDGPLTVQMSMYGGFEQVGSLGTSLPRNDEQTTTQAGDIVLYSGSQIVVFYGTNSWAYTRLGRIDGLSGSELADLLGSGPVELSIFTE